MKRILGSLLLFPLALFASYSWEMKLAKKEVFKEEPFLIEFICQFEGRDPDIYIDLKPKVDGMKFMRLDYTDDVIDNKRRVHYRFVARASAVGALKIALEVLMKETTEDSIRETTIGRDNNKELVFETTKLLLPPQTLLVKESGLENKIVGDFTIEEYVSGESVGAFEPVQLVRKIKGVGNFKEIPTAALEIDGVRIFANDVVERLTLTPQGYQGEMIWRFALIADKNYTIPAETLSYFNSRSQRIENLKAGAQKIAVAKPQDAAELLDQEIYPDERSAVDWGAYLSQLGLFLLGMATLFIGQKAYGLYQKERPKAWYESVTSVDSLLLQLISRDSAKYRRLIDEIDLHRQEKRIKSLNYYKLQLKTIGK